MKKSVVIFVIGIMFAFIALHGVNYLYTVNQLDRKQTWLIRENVNVNQEKLMLITRGFKLGHSIEDMVSITELRVEKVTEIFVILSKLNDRELRILKAALQQGERRMTLIEYFLLPTNRL